MFGWQAAARVIADVAKGASPFRALQNAYLRQRDWRPGMRVLDIGGSPTRRKIDLPLANRRIVYADLEATDPDVVQWDVTRPPPDNLGRFDCVLLLNVLEHVYDPAAALRSVGATIEPAGELVIVTPYLYPYHRAPLDYYRFSADWYRAVAAENRYDLIELVPLSFGCASDVAGFAVSYAYMFRWLQTLRPLVAAAFALPLLFDLVTVGLLRKLGRHAESYFRNPLGYAAVMRPTTAAWETGP